MSFKKAKIGEHELYYGDCLEVMPTLKDKSIDMILTDLPYGTTSCKWDIIIPFEPLWKQYKRIIKNNGSAILLFGSEPFSSLLRTSNLEMYKYDWIWDKKIPSGMSYARFQPMRQHELISVFCNGKTKYNPQMVERDVPIKGGGMGQSDSAATIGYKPLKRTYTHKNPITIITFDKIRKGSVHPTQKPIPLLEYLIKTYTDEGDLVLDNTMGSGSTGEACMNLNRRFIGIEKDKEYFRIAYNRLRELVPNPL